MRVVNGSKKEVCDITLTWASLNIFDGKKTLIGSQEAPTKNKVANNARRKETYKVVRSVH